MCCPGPPIFYLFLHLLQHNPSYAVQPQDLNSEKSSALSSRNMDAITSLTQGTSYNRQFEGRSYLSGEHSSLDGNISNNREDQSPTKISIMEQGSCFTCNTLSSGDWCSNVSRYIDYRRNHDQELPKDLNGTQLESACPVNHRFCQVRRVVYRVTNMTNFEPWGMERNCTKECKPFCVTMGGRTKITYCTSCCRWDGLGQNNNNCNTDNFANTSNPDFLRLLFSLGILYNFFSCKNYKL